MAERTQGCRVDLEPKKEKERGGKQVTKGREQTMRLFSHGSETAMPTRNAPIAADTCRRCAAPATSEDRAKSG